MSKKSINFAADGTQILTECQAPTGKLSYDYMVQSNAGGFGGGTLTLLISLDGGTTKNPMKDQSGTAYSVTAADTLTGSVPARLNANDVRPIIYAKLTGSTNPNLTLTVVDNR